MQLENLKSPCSWDRDLWEVRTDLASFHGDLGGPDREGLALEDVKRGAELQHHVCCNQNTPPRMHEIKLFKVFIIMSSVSLTAKTHTFFA